MELPPLRVPSLWYEIHVLDNQVLVTGCLLPERLNDEDCVVVFANEFSRNYISVFGIPSRLDSTIFVLAVAVSLGLWHVRGTYVSNLFCYLVFSMGLSRKSRNKTFVRYETLEISVLVNFLWLYRRYKYRETS